MSDLPPLPQAAFTHFRAIEPACSFGWLGEIVDGYTADQMRAYATAAIAAARGEAQPVACRKHFEDKVFNRYFRSTIVRNPNPPKGFGGLDFISTADLTQAQLCARDGDGYAREDVAAMWFGYQLACKAFDASPQSAPPAAISDDTAQTAFRHLRGIVDHWGEFGPEHGLNEAMHYAHEFLSGADAQRAMFGAATAQQAAAGDAEAAKP